MGVSLPDELDEQHWWRGRTEGGIVVFGRLVPAGFIPTGFFRPGFVVRPGNVPPDGEAGRPRSEAAGKFATGEGIGLGHGGFSGLSDGHGVDAVDHSAG